MCMSARKRKSCQLAKQDHNGTDHRQRVSNAEPAGAERLPDISLRAQEHIPFTDQERRQVRAELLAWYDTNHRVLPWRRNPHSVRKASPQDKYQPVGPETSQQQFGYMVWVCEIMSQQTQVSRVAEYFTRWISKWPTVQDLAVATQEEVNDMWAGLGYYRRARYLLEGAQYVQNTLSGQMPLTAAELQKIPGVGPYTGNAIASIAGNQRVAVVDANVVRVLARLQKIGGDTKGSTATKLLAGLADALVDPDRPGCFNQAMMELGACVCTGHQAPACSACPIQQHCRAYADEQQYLADGGYPADTDMPHVTQYPAKAVKAAKRKEHVAVCIVEARGSKDAAGQDQFLLVQRPPQGLLAGLWEFPSHVVNSALACQQEERWAGSKQVVGDLIGQPLMQDSSGVKLSHLGTATHTFSHIQQTMIIDLLTFQKVDSPKLSQSGSKVCSQWVSREAMDTLGLSSGVKKVWRLFVSAEGR